MMRGPVSHPLAMASRKAKGDAVIGAAKIAHGGEAGVERLARVPGRFVGLAGGAVGHVGELAFNAGAVRGEMDVAIDEPGQNEAVLQIDDRRAGGSLGEAVLNRDDLSFCDQDAGIASRLLARTVEERAGVDDNIRLGRGGWRRRLGDKRGGEESQGQKEPVRAGA